jgi:hypothetical protein
MVKIIKRDNSRNTQVLNDNDIRAVKNAGSFIVLFGKDF